VQPKDCFKKFTFSDISNVGNLITFLPSCFKSQIRECFKCSCCNFKINMGMNGVKYLLGISFSQLTIAENSGDQKFRYCN
jgi:hypothetical protein